MKKTIIILLCILNSSIVFSQVNFSSSELKADADLLWRALNELHPGLYRNTDTLQIKKAYQALLNDLSSERNAKEAFISFSKFTASIKCGHTYLNPFNQNNKIISSITANKVLLPFTFVIIDKKMIVETSFSEFISNNQIVTHINGVKIEAIIDSLSLLIKADGNRENKKVNDLEVHLSSKYEYFDYYFPMMYGLRDSTKLTFSDGKSQRIELISKTERKTAFSTMFPNQTGSTYDKLWNKEIHEDYAYLQLGTFVTWRLTFDWKKYLDDFFAELNTKQIKNLVIDIRGNEGGLTDATDYLVKKLANKEGQTVFRKPHLAYKIVSDSLKPHVTTWSKGFYNNSIWTKTLDENYRTIKFTANKPKPVKKNRNAFMGQTYLLVNESNSSATFILAEICKKNNYAFLVGNETGGTARGITAGQIFFLTLPNSNIEVDIPLIGRYPMSVVNDEGIQPDLNVQRTVTGYANGRDEQLEAVMKLIKESL